MENRPFQLVPSPDEFPNQTPPFQNPEIQSPAVPQFEDVPLQMSPFCDARWDMDVIENKRRKEIHRDYVYSYRKPIQQYQVPPQEQQRVMLEESQPRVATPRTTAEIPWTAEGGEPIKNDFPKPKPLAEIKLEPPNPPYLYPKILNKRTEAEEKGNILSKIPAMTKTGVNHYGVHVSFWQFPNKT